MKTSTLFKTSIYQQEEEVRSLTTLLQTFQINSNLYSNPCPSISDHDALCIIAKIPTNKYQPRCKFIRDMKNFDLQKYFNDFKQLPFSIVFSFDNPHDQLDILNNIILKCIKRHSPLKRIKFTRPPGPCMKERSWHSRTSESKKQIKVRSTFKKDKISLGCIQKSKKRNQTENKYN